MMEFVNVAYKVAGKYALVFYISFDRCLNFMLLTLKEMPLSGFFPMKL